MDKLQRLNSFFSGIFKSWIDVNISNLNKNRHLIKRANLEILDNFIKARDEKNPFKRLKFYFKAGTFRQSTIENIVFIFGIFFNKI